MSKVNPGVVVGVRMIAKNLSTDELVSLYMAATSGFDPRGVQGYEKGKALFAQEGGTKMHTDTLAVLDMIVQERLSEPATGVPQVIIFVDEKPDLPPEGR
jgi:hypothetical protein